MDDEKVMKDIDFSRFEEEFKLGNAPIIKKGTNDTAPDGGNLGVANGTGTLRSIKILFA